MNRILSVAWREFSSTAITKGFIIGAFVVPAAIALLIPVLVMMLKNIKPPAIEGTVAVVDHSGLVAPQIEQTLSPEGIARRRTATSEQISAAAGEALGPLAGQMESPAAKQAMQQRLEEAMGQAPTFRIESVDPAAAADEAALEALKESLRPSAADDAGSRMAVVVVAADAAVKEPDAPAYGGYELFIRAKVDERVVDEIRRGVREAILEARYANSPFERDEVRALTTVESGGTREITDTGERASSGELNMLLPGAFMLLLMMGVMTGGQYLLTTTIEEKSSRVVEVILSAVSPMQLMTGKILGQLAVGLLLLAIYAGLGVAALAVFAMMDLIEPMSIVYLIIFFMLAYFMLASLLAAVGSAVNDFREAQSLQTPVMLIVMVPWILWLPISQSPNSTLAVVLSYLPPISPFVMMMRVTSTTPPPTWEILLSIAVAAVGCYVCVWFAAKVFRVGLLMYGKPPNLTTLIRWVRMA